MQVTLINGLGDRLLDFLGAKVVSKFKNLPLQVIWNPVEQHFAFGIAKYDPKLFDYLDVDSTVEKRSDNIHIQNENPSVTLSPCVVYKWLQQHGVSVAWEDVCQAYIDFAKPLSHSSILEPYISPNIHDYIGIHLRRSDKINIFENKHKQHTTTPSEYEKIMENVLDHVRQLCAIQKSPRFYVVSDDHSYKETFLEKVKNIAQQECSTATIVTTSVDMLPTSITSAYSGAFDVFEFLCLCRCKSILQGIKYSTYSITAALISQAPLFNFHDVSDPNLLTLWRPCLHVLPSADIDPNTLLQDWTELPISS